MHVMTKYLDTSKAAIASLQDFAVMEQATNDDADQRGQLQVASTRVAQGGDGAHRRLEPAVGPHQAQDHEHDGVEDRTRDQRRDQRPGEAAGEREPHQRQEGARVRPDPAEVGGRADRRPAERRELVGGQQLHGGRTRERDEQGRELDQSAAADDRVDEPRRQRGQRQQRDHLQGRIGHPVRLGGSRAPGCQRVRCPADHVR